MKPRILVVDDQEAIRFGLRDFLESHGYQVEEAATMQAGLDRLLGQTFSAAFVDYRLPDGDALQLLAGLREANVRVPVILLTAYGSIDLAVRAIQEGAEHLLTKPIELPSLKVILERVLENHRNRQKQLAGQATATRLDPDPFVGTSAAIRALAADAAKVVDSDSPLLLQGETGTGKGVLAAWFHRRGPRADEAFVDLNCAGLSRELVESELFGHVKGSFTGAFAQKTGLLEVAHRGTVFLDEIGDLDPAIQPKLLKVLEDHRFRRLGDTRDRSVDVRLISATHQDLHEAIRERRFRSDLYYRVAALPLRLPALRDRLEDLPPLVEALLARLRVELGRAELALTPRALAALAQYAWPGNVRELRNVLERAALLASGPAIDTGDLRFAAAAPAAGEALDPGLTLAEMERRFIQRALADCGGHVGRAAVRLGIPRSTLYLKIKYFGLARK